MTIFLRPFISVSMARSFTYLVCFLLVFTGCKKDKKSENPIPDSPVENSLTVHLSYLVDANPLHFEQTEYISAANYPYSVSKLNYYLSQLSLIKSDSSLLVLKNYHYADAAIPETNTFQLGSIPAGHYVGFTCNIGLDSNQNKSNSLAATNDNINMQWPEPMGGGYHFLKLEGYFTDSTKTYGYAMHLGTKACLVKIKLLKALVVKESGNTDLKLSMDLAEWFKNPNTFDFVKDGNYIMGNAIAMKKVTDNGKDVFKLLP